MPWRDFFQIMTSTQMMIRRKTILSFIDFRLVVSEKMHTQVCVKKRGITAWLPKLRKGHIRAVLCRGKDTHQNLTMETEKWTVTKELNAQYGCPN